MHKEEEHKVPFELAIFFGGHSALFLLLFCQVSLAISCLNNLPLLSSLLSTMYTVSYEG